MKETFDARDVEDRVSFDMNKLMQQAQQMQAQMAQAQEEVANEVVEASAGGGMVKVKVSGAMELKEIWIDPEAIDPDDPETARRTSSSPPSTRGSARRSRWSSSGSAG